MKGIELYRHIQISYFHLISPKSWKWWKVLKWINERQVQNIRTELVTVFTGQTRSREQFLFPVSNKDGSFASQDEHTHCSPRKDGHHRHTGRPAEHLPVDLTHPALNRERQQTAWIHSCSFKQIFSLHLFHTHTHTHTQVVSAHYAAWGSTLLSSHCSERLSCLWATVNLTDRGLHQLSSIYWREEVRRLLCIMEIN